MSTLTIASDPQDAAAAEAVEAHHEQLAGELAGRVTMLLAAAEGDPAEAETVRSALVGFCDRDLLPPRSGPSTRPPATCPRRGC